MANFINILERVHYLNHPYLSGLSALFTLSIGVFVLIRNIKSELYRVFFWANFTVSFWFLGNVLSMLYFRNLDASLFWFKVAYTTVPFTSVSYYHFYLVQCKKKKRGLRLLYALGIPELIYMWSTNHVNIGARALPNVGIFWEKFSVFTYFGLYTMVKYLIISWFVVFSFYREYKKETILLRKNQLKYLTLAAIVASMGAVEWFVVFGIPLHFAWVIIPPFFGIMAYVIVRYKAMEIDTVIHRTVLWIITVFLLILPAVITNLALGKFVLVNNAFLYFCLTGIYLIFFVDYYNHFRPRIDHLFRRRKYEYQTILTRIAGRVATTIDIEDFTQQLLVQLSETMYLRNSLLYVLSKDETKYILAGRYGYKEAKGARRSSEVELFNEEEKTKVINLAYSEIALTTPVCRWLGQKREVLEKEQIEVNPEYKAIKEDSLSLFFKEEIELIVPLVLEDKVSGLLGLGKKENLRAYTLKDIELLRKLGREVGVTVYNALRYRALLNNDRLEEELRLGREIQMNLLPKELPCIANLDISGFMLPAKEIGGDYYDFINLPKEDNLAIVIGDVSGKGVAAGLIMATAKATLKGLSRQNLSPRQILAQTNNLLYEYTNGSKFMTLLYFQYNPGDRTLTYSSAGHEHILIYHSKADTVECITSGGFMLGILLNIEPYLKERKITLEPKDKLLLYTDGITEAESLSGERFGLERLKEAFKTHSQKPVFELIQAVKDEVYSFIGTQPQYDDITLVGLEGRLPIAREDKVPL